MDKIPITQRAYVVGNGRHLNRWKIDGYNGLFQFRIMFGKRQHPFEGEVVAKFKTHDPTGYSIGCFRPCDGVIPLIKIPVKKIEIQGKSYFRISWGTGWRCLPGEEWTAELEKEARKVLRNRRITELEFGFED